LKRISYGNNNLHPKDYMMFLDGIEEFTVIPDLRIKKLNLELGSITINT